MATKLVHRLKIQEIYSALDTLKDSGWHSKVVYTPKEVWKGKEISFPIMAYTSPKTGRALWIISGIHGEEPAGPCAIAENIDTIQKLGKNIPVVLLPLCNPHGYYKNYRYPYQKRWEKNGENRSIDVSELYLPDLKNPSKRRAYISAFPESKALIAKILELVKEYPPVVSIDLHEDNLLNEGYIYCSGTDRNLMRKVSKYVFDLFENAGVKIKESGKTRFGELINYGVVWDAIDDSLDELLSSRTIVVNNQSVPGPSSKVSIVVETSAKSLPLSLRINTHSAIIHSLKKISTLAGL